MESSNYDEDLPTLRPHGIGWLWFIMFWLGLIVAFIWAVLKTLGYINSPPWQEALPAFAFFLSVVGGAFVLGQILDDMRRTLKTVQRDMRALSVNLGTEVREVKTEVKGLRTEFTAHMHKYHQ